MILRAEIVRSADSLYIATEEYVFSGNRYRGDIKEWPEFKQSLPEHLCGIVGNDPITIRLNNISNGVDDTWAEIFDAEEIRGCDVTLYAAGLGTYYGSVTDRGIEGNEAYISIKERDDGFDELLPKGVVTASAFTSTAIDIGAVIPLCYGYCKNVPCPNIQNYKPGTSVTTDSDSSGTLLIDDASDGGFSAEDIGRYAHNVTQGTYALITDVSSDGTEATVDSAIFDTTGDVYGIRCFDYLLCYGTIAGVWDSATGRGIKRNGVLVSSSEYTVDDGSGDTGRPNCDADHGYPGYATIRFAFEQVDFGGQAYAITADILGIDDAADPGREPIQNYATILEDIINDSTRGLGLAVNASGFASVAASRPTASWSCSLPIYQKRAAKDIINELLFSCRAKLSRTRNAEWLLSSVGSSTSSESFGDSDGYYNNCDVLSSGVTPSDQAISTAYLEYGNENTQKFELSLVCRTGFGQIDRTVIENTDTLATAKKILSFIYGMAVYGDKRLTLKTVKGESSSRLVGDIITITAAKYNLSSAEYRIFSKRKRDIEDVYDCVSYNNSIFSDQTIGDPTSSTEPNVSSGLRAIADAVMASYGYEVNVIGNIGSGAASIDLSEGTIHTATADNAAGTLSFDNVSSLADGNEFHLFLTNGGILSSPWPTSAKFAGGVTPTLTSSGVDWIHGISPDGGSTWHINVVSLDSK